MNKVFIKKMMQAKKLQYEAIKEIMPSSMKSRIDAFEKESFDLIKDIAFEMLRESQDDEDEPVEEDSTEGSTASKRVSKKTKKVSVEFN